MFASTLQRLAQRLMLVLPLVVLLLLLGEPSRIAADQGGARVFDLTTTVPVESVEILPPNPCSESIRVTGNFQIQAHVVIPPGSPGSMHVTLHLNADGISGTGLSTGAPYVGGEGGTASVKPPNPNFSFQTEFLLRTVPGPGHYQLNPCRIQPTFNIVMLSSAGGFNIEATLGGWGPHICFWSQLGSGTNGPVNALATDGVGNLYAGGAFTMASPLIGLAAPMYIAKWGGKTWSALGSGMNNHVYALAVDGSGDLYAGGAFTALAGGGGISHVAKWSGGFWYGLGGGVNNTVWALAVDASSNLYAGGDFTAAGGTSAIDIAKWNGSSWTALGSGMNGRVSALAADASGNLYVGGWFTTAGGISANRIAKWNGKSWSALGSGMNSPVLGLAVDASGNLYAGGNFTAAGGVSANYIAKWNGKSWSALGSGLNNSVDAIAVTMNGFGPVYAGGGFATAGGVSANYIAEWNGGNWYGLGSGTDGIVFALAARGSSVFAGGSFNKAGGLPANYIARWC